MHPVVVAAPACNAFAWGAMPTLRPHCREHAGQAEQNEPAASWVACPAEPLCGLGMAEAHGESTTGQDCDPRRELSPTLKSDERNEFGGSGKTGRLVGEASMSRTRAATAARSFAPAEQASEAASA